MIDYKTFDEQIEILKRRGLFIKNEMSAKTFLERNNYYNVINAYKDVFIKSGITPETFIENATFSEISALFDFDKTLRLIFSYDLIFIERTFKSIIAHEFTRTHLNHDYTNVNNFDLYFHAIQSSQLVTKIARELEKEELKGNEMICHYLRTYHSIPLWIAVNILSFGTVSKFFACMKQSDQKNVCIRLSQIYGKRLTIPDVNNAIKICVLLRNKAAHDQRIYDFSSKSLSVSQTHPLMQEYNISSPVHNLFGAICSMYYLTTKQEFNNIKNQLIVATRELTDQIFCINPCAIIDKTGIPYSFLELT
jgi:abortive infection bacteriophage resistance protein